MHFGLSETQQSIKNSAKEFFGAECPIAEVRRLAETEHAMEPKLWKKIAEQGWTGIIFPEAHDGMGLGYVEMAVAFEEMGRALVPGPLLSTLVAGSVLEHAASEDQKKKYLSAICRGEAKGTLALLERSASWNPADVKLTAANHTLTGEKLFVPDAAADFLLVAASDGIHLVPSNAAGVRIMKTPGIDLTRRLYAVTFDNVPAEPVATGARATAALEAALDIAALATAAEMVGGMQRLLDLTVEYAKTRKQFGKPIGTFQAVQHQCADMLFYLEGARAAVYYAACLLSENDPGARAAISVAKAYASDTFRLCGNSAIQVHGGMGFTWENDAHLFYRRAKASETAFGDATFHRERLAKILLD
ncbi:MAG TPA: acyl-CoA dehydrogenase family protein [Bryobacteraceae bacterium]|nr:acyl-CoA dehydrogenase family protein [Bryobacteraceae bacterium]